MFSTFFKILYVYIDLTISTIIMDTNIEEIPLLYDFVIDSGLDGIYFLPLFQNFNSEYHPRWYRNSELWPNNFKKVCNLIDWLINQKLKEETPQHPIIINSIIQLEFFKEYYKNPAKKLNTICLAGKRMFSISEDGHILLCPMVEPLGNILKDDLRHLWYSDQAEEIRKRIGHCDRNCKILGCYSDV